MASPPSPRFPSAPRSWSLRATRVVMLAVLGLASLGASVGTGCSIVASPSASLDTDAGPLPEDIPTTTTPTYDGQVEDAAPPSKSYRGSPLCHAQKESCWPDDGALQCGGAPTADDAGRSSDGGSTNLPAGDACRVTSDGPACTPSGTGRDGSSCKASSDCSSGAECVLRTGNQGGQCRRYCCTGTCTNVPSPSGGATFCDVAQLNEEASVKVPVCMPVKPCKLLTQGQCETGESCAVVTDVGLTSCVPTGSAQVGESCEENHCTAGLTCLGRPGARKCFQLCKIGQTACGPTLQCKASSLIRDAAYGLCQAP